MNWPYRPRQLSLGPLELEILTLLWAQGSTTAKTIHDQILSDPDRELAYASVMTVLQRLEQKGWIRSHRSPPPDASGQPQRLNRSFIWEALVSQKRAQALLAYDHLHRFLKAGDPDVVVAFANELDQASVEQLADIAERLRKARLDQEQNP